jgi:hypothetical protein
MVRGFLSLRYNGTFRSSISSAIIEEIENLRQAGSAWIAYYYFDSKDISKRDLRGLLASLIFQLGGCSGFIWDALRNLYTTCRDGSQQPSEAALAKCLKNMLESLVKFPFPLSKMLWMNVRVPPGLHPPSKKCRTEDLLMSNYPNLFTCIKVVPSKTYMPLSTLLLLRRHVCSCKKKVAKGRISTTISALLFVQAEKCGDGEKRIKNSLSMLSRKERTGCETPLLPSYRLFLTLGQV